jgi:hypothetical protein
MKEIFSYSEKLGCLNLCAFEIYFIKVGPSPFLLQTVFLHRNLYAKKNETNST